MLSCKKQFSRRFYKVTFLALNVLLLETVLFHVLRYVYDYYLAIMVIGLAVLGIGLGAFAAGLTGFAEDDIFLISCAGTSISLFAVAVSIVKYYPHFWVASITIIVCFFFPVFYISSVFKNNDSRRVYLYDMIGAFLGVTVTVLLYGFVSSETIFILIMISFTSAGLIASVCKIRKILTPAFALLVLAALFLLYQHLSHDSFNVFKMLQENGRRPNIAGYMKKSFHSPLKLTASYDNLMGRVDILPTGGELFQTVYVNGFASDRFSRKRLKEYEKSFKPYGVKWTSRDKRILYGLCEEPRIFIVGSSVEGIVKSAKMITPLEKIVPVEINTSILKIVREDFIEESGDPYNGLNTIVGNALSILKSSSESFDIITLLNTHSTANISYLGPPDYLHTLENYDLYFERLNEKGYLNFEEKPVGENGQLAFYRQLNTLWHVLKRRGAYDPREHFVIWQWSNTVPRYTYGYYVSMIVTKNPIDSGMTDSINAWFKHVNNKNMSRVPIKYFKGYKEDREYSHLFNMIEHSDFSDLHDKDFNTAVVTNNCPFLSASKTSNQRLSAIMRYAGSAMIVLALFFGISAVQGCPRKSLGGLFALYNFTIGMAYFFIEIIFIQIYQNVFVSVSSTMILVLGALLLSSGVGGLYSRIARSFVFTMILLPVSAAAVIAPFYLVRLDISSELTGFVSVVLICLSGFMMGTYFPKGIDVAKSCGLGKKVPVYFAVNAVGGSLAVILALFMGVKAGYSMTLMLALLLYLFSGIILTFIERNCN